MQQQSILPGLAASLVGAIGLWLILSPLLMSVSGGAAYSQIAGGVALIAISLAGLTVRNGLVMFSVAVAGLWLALTIVLFSASSAAQLNLLVASFLVLSAAATDSVVLRKSVSV